MRLRNDGFYNADEGKHFILTQKGKEECVSYAHKTVGEPVDKYDTEAVSWAVEKQYVTEVDIPDWIVTTGYEVVYEHNGTVICVGNRIVFPDQTLAERYKRHYEDYSWMKNKMLFIRETIYKGRTLKDCRMHDGKKVYNESWYFGIDALEIGNLMEEDVVYTLLDLVPPATVTRTYLQLGEPVTTRFDDAGKLRTTYTTFKKVADSTWEYCGDCFRGEDTVSGTRPAYV